MAQVLSETWHGDESSPLHCVVPFIQTDCIRNVPGTAHRPFPMVSLTGGLVCPRRGWKDVLERFYLCAACFYASVFRRHFCYGFGIHWPLLHPAHAFRPLPIKRIPADKFPDQAGRWNFVIHVCLLHKVQNSDDITNLVIPAVLGLNGLQKRVNVFFEDCQFV